MPASPDELNDRFAIPDAARFDRGPSGLARLVVTTDLAEAHVYLHGAHVAHYQPRRQAAVLFTSERSRFAPGQPIRGGVPVIFPWFGPKRDDPAAPPHGIARLMEWDVRRVERRGDGAVAATFALASSPSTLERFPHRFSLSFTVTVGNTLEMALTVRNESAEPLVFEEALHTYFAVADARRVTVAGLTGAAYADKTRDFQRFTDAAAPFAFAGPTDRVYTGTRATCTIDDPGLGRRVAVEKDGSATTVVWNPWEGHKPMPDLGADEWPRFVCIETANAADDAVTLAAGAEHTMRASIRATPAPTDGGDA